MAIKSPKNKGASGEREAARLLVEWAAEVGVDIDPSRNLEQTRGGGFDLNGVDGLAIEVKRVENMALPSWWRQAVRQADDVGWRPFLMWRQNRKPWKFRVRLWVDGIVLDADLEKGEAKKWFQAWIKSR